MVCPAHWAPDGPLSAPLRPNTARLSPHGAPFGSSGLSSLPELMSICSGWPSYPLACSAILPTDLGHPWGGWEVP